MKGIFPQSMRRLPRRLVGVGVVLVIGMVLAGWYYLSPEYAECGYAPVQPVPFSHRTHVGKLGMDCRFCHPGAEQDKTAALPPAQLCMDCHQQILPDIPALAPLRDALAADRPVPWIQIYRLPDFVVFHHGIHTAVGVGCTDCHGPIQDRDVTRVEKAMSMRFCLRCHEDPASYLRPTNQVFAWDWKPKDPAQQRKRNFRWMQAHGIRARTDCSACHR